MYAKIFKSLFYGSMSGQADTQHVFICLLAHCDHEGHVELPPAAISALTGIPIDRVMSAISVLESPDPMSRTKEHDGRRIDAECVGRWTVLNYLKYRGLRDEHQRREQNKAAKHKERMSAKVSQASAVVSQGQPPSAQEEVEVEVEELDPKTCPSGDGLVRGTDLLGKNPKADWLEAFDLDFYPRYPRKAKPDEARKAWLQMKPWSQVNCDLIMEGLRQWVGFWEKNETEKEHIPYPASFLRSGQWKEPPQ